MNNQLSLVPIANLHQGVFEHLIVFSDVDVLIDFDSEDLRLQASGMNTYVIVDFYAPTINGLKRKMRSYLSNTKFLNAGGKHCRIAFALIGDQLTKLEDFEYFKALSLIATKSDWVICGFATNSVDKPFYKLSMFCLME